MTSLDYMCQEKKEEVDLPALKIASMCQIQGLEDYMKNIKEKLIKPTKNNTDSIIINE